VSTVRITQIRSTVGQSTPHEGTLRALGLGKIGRTVERKDSPELRGMLRHVNHLVRIDADGGQGAAERA
jgi:large subunit ribosomal protein L30